MSVIMRNPVEFIRFTTSARGVLVTAAILASVTGIASAIGTSSHGPGPNEGALQPVLARSPDGAGLQTTEHLNDYRAAFLFACSATAIEEARRSELDALVALGSAAVAAFEPAGSYDQALLHAGAALAAAQDVARNAHAEVKSALSRLTAGKDLSPEDLVDLHRLLGLKL